MASRLAAGVEVAGPAGKSVLPPLALTANPGLLRTIAEKKILDDGLKAEMTKVIRETKERFVGEKKAAAVGK